MERPAGRARTGGRRWGRRDGLRFVDTLRRPERRSWSRTTTGPCPATGRATQRRVGAGGGRRGLEQGQPGGGGRRGGEVPLQQIAWRAASSAGTVVRRVLPGTTPR